MIITIHKTEDERPEYQYTITVYASRKGRVTRAIVTIRCESYNRLSDLILCKTGVTHQTIELGKNDEVRED